MKTFIKNAYQSYVTPLRLTTNKFNDLLAVKGGIRLINSCKAILLLIGFTVSPSRIRIIVVFLRRLHKIFKHQGPKGTVLMLKTLSVLLQQSLGGMRIPNPRLIAKSAVAVNNKGLSRLIPALDREKIRRGDTQVIRFWLSMFHIYRLITYKGKVDISTITADCTGTHVHDATLCSYIPMFIQLFVYDRFSSDALLRVLERACQGTFKVVMKTAPGTNYNDNTFATQAHIMFLAVNTIIRKGFLLGALFTVMETLGNKEALFLLKSFMDLNHALHDRGVHLLGAQLPEIGKLGFKDEAAGKVRVFAMVDGFTQAALLPLHELLFHILADVPTDGTFDQMKPILRMVHSGEEFAMDASGVLKPQGRGRWSLDLSAATDRLPMDLQVLLIRELLTPLVGPENAKRFSGAWALLLVGRGYKAGNLSPAPGVHYYHTGQPMGALSSWASLAFTHHFLVQSAAWMSGHTASGVLYTNYAILGDDLVLGDKIVADMYLKLLDSLGVKCGLHKSIISPKGTALEFAKRTFYKGQDVSPIPFRELAAATQSIAGFTAIVRKYSLPTHKALQAFGFGFHTYANLNKRLGSFGARARMLLLALAVPQTEADVKDMFAMGAPKAPRFVGDAIATAKTFLQVEVPLLRERVHKAFMNSESFSIIQRSFDEADMLLARHISKAEDNLSDLRSEYEVKPTRWLKNKIVTLEAELYLVKSDEIRTLVAGTFHDYNLAVYTPIQIKYGRILVAIEEIAKRLSKPNISFEVAYTEFIAASSEFALLNEDAYSATRIDPSSGVKGLFDPIAARLWKRWAPMLQGSQSLETAVKTDDFPMIVYRKFV